jgi:branched-chain amino acid transport system substrate-binding protein
MQFRSILAAGITACACLGASAQVPAKPIRIGLVFPLTGGSADMGNSARIGAEAAVAEINEVGGYLGRPWNWIRDDKADSDMACSTRRSGGEGEGHRQHWLPQPGGP